MSSPHRSARWKTLGTIGIFSIATVLTGCPAGTERPQRIVTPDAVGIIEQIEGSEDGTTKTLRLQSGEEIVVHNTDDIEAYGGPNTGSLLVSGRLDGLRWHMSLPPSDLVPTSCYALGARPFDDGSHVVFAAGSPAGAYGIQLPKADDFEAEEPNRQTQRYGSTGVPVFFCVNELGEVTGQEDLLGRDSE
ncbi:MAG: hypothetical protein ACREIV_08035 [Planctomycetaceae bacterium]